MTKHVLITGGSKGIGRAAAIRFGETGATVHINYRNDVEAAQATARNVEEAGGTVHLLPGDVSDPGVAESVVSKVAEVTDRLDLIVHGAVRSVRGSPSELTYEEYLEGVLVNGCSLFAVVRPALPLLGSGSSVVFLSSSGAKRAIRGYFGLGAPKALAEATIRYLAADLAPRGIGCFVVTPGALSTEAFAAQFSDPDKVLTAAQRANPVGRPVSFDDVTEVLLHLASGRTTMLTGTEFQVDGGLHLRG